jgi:hypothetical protein
VRRLVRDRNEIAAGGPWRGSHAPCPCPPLRCTPRVAGPRTRAV